MKIVAFAASNSSQSINKQLVQYATSLIEGAEIEILDLNDYEMPIYSSDREQADGIPSQAQEFYDKIGSADAVIISYAEYNGAYTPAYKNTFDWTSRIAMKVFQDKPMLLLSASPGKGGAGNVLKQAIESAPYFGGVVKASLSIPSFGANFDSEKGALTNQELNAALQKAVSSLK